MRHRGRSAIAAVIGSVLLLAGCTQAVSGSGESQEGITFPSDIQGLGALLIRGNDAIKTAHLQLNESAGGTAIKALGDEELANGTVQSIDLSETVGSLALRFIIIGATVYAKLPAAVYQSPKPWVEISPTTSRPEVAAALHVVSDIDPDRCRQERRQPRVGGQGPELQGQGAAQRGDRRPLQAQRRCEFAADRLPESRCARTERADQAARSRSTSTSRAVRAR